MYRREGEEDHRDLAKAPYSLSQGGGGTAQRGRPERDHREPKGELHRLIVGGDQHARERVVAQHVYRARAGSRHVQEAKQVGEGRGLTHKDIEGWLASRRGGQALAKARVGRASLLGTTGVGQALELGREGGAGKHLLEGEGRHPATATTMYGVKVRAEQPYIGCFRVHQLTGMRFPKDVERNDSVHDLGGSGTCLIPRVPT